MTSPNGQSHRTPELQILPFVISSDIPHLLRLKLSEGAKPKTAEMHTSLAVTVPSIGLANEMRPKQPQRSSFGTNHRRFVLSSGPPSARRIDRISKSRKELKADNKSQLCCVSNIVAIWTVFCSY